MARRSKKNQMQEEMMLRRQRYKRLAVYVFMLSLFSGFLGLLYQKLTDENTLPLKTVRINGDFKFLDTEELKDLLRVQLKKNFLSIDIEGIQKSVMEIPWVDHVSIKRKWPDTLLLSVREHRPLARWSKGGLVNQRGEWFAANEKQSVNQLPELDGPEGSVTMLSAEYLNLNNKLQPLGLQTLRLSMSHRRSWRLDLGNGLTLHLGRMQVHERLQRFLRIYKQIIAEQLENIESVDMRYTNGFAVRWKPGMELQDDNNNKEDLKDA